MAADGGEGGDPCGPRPALRGRKLNLQVTQLAKNGMQCWVLVHRAPVEAISLDHILPWTFHRQIRMLPR